MNNNLILHCDLNNFYASVECVLNPLLKNKPLAVSGDPTLRHGVILAKNEIAKKKGIKTGDVIWEAKNKEPELVIVPPHFDIYMNFSKQIFEIYKKFTPLVEPFGADECWLDCTGSVNLFGSGQEIANKIREIIKKETSLTASVGVSFNKIFSKLGSDLKKPDATIIIDNNNYKQMLYGLPVDYMMYIGPSAKQKLNKMNIYTIGDLATAPDYYIIKSFGKNGLSMLKNARGQNEEPVREAEIKRKVKSVGHGTTTIKDITNYSDAYDVIIYLSDLVAVRLRKYGLCGYGIRLDLRDKNLESFSKQTKTNNPISTSKCLADNAYKMLKSIWKSSRPLRTITVSVFDLSLSKHNLQLTYLNDNNERTEALERCLDKIKNKYGKDTIIRGNLIGKDFIYDKDENEDFLPFKR